MVFLDSISLGDDSVLMSEATYCAEDQGKYSEYQKILFESQQGIDDWAKSEQLKKFATDLKLDAELFKSCLDSGKYEKKIKYSTYEAKKNGINRLPTFIIIDSAGNSEKISGASSYPIFKEKIDLKENIYLYS